MDEAKKSKLNITVILAFIGFVILIVALAVAIILAPKRIDADYTLVQRYIVELEDMWVIDSETEAHITIPNDAPENLLLKYETDYRVSKLYINDELLIETTANDLSSCIYTYWIGFDSSGENNVLSLECDSNEDLKSIIRTDSYLGTSTDVISQFILDCLFPLVFSSLAIIGGMLIGFVNGLIHLKKEINTRVNVFFLGLFITVSGWWILTDCQILSLFIDGCETVNAINFVASTCIAPAMLMIVKDMFDDDHKILDVFRLILTYMTCAGLLAWIIFELPIFTLLTVSHVLLAVVSLIAIYIGWREWQKYHSKHVGLLVIGMIGFVLGSAVTILFYYLDGAGAYCMIYTITLIYFIIIVLVSAYFRISQHIRKLEISERDALEQARQSAETASNAKTSFLLSVSHDIRTPMNAILGYANIAKKHLDDKEYTESCLANITSAGDILLGIINDVLDMSRIESGELTINETPINIIDFARNMQAVISDSAIGKSLHLETGFNEVQDTTVFADKMHLESVLLNILSNAVKYTDVGGSIFFGLRQSSSQQEGFARYTFTVTDDGAGMTRDFLEKIYEPFARADITGVKGTGLGMAITKNLVDMMHGDINITSIPGNGTSVKISFDFKIAETLVSAAEVSGNFDILKDKRVLIVDDNRQNREIIKSIMSFAGIITEESDDGAFAVEMVRNNEPGYYDALIMDIQMPYMDGYKATSLIRALGNKEKASVPIIAMTANAFEIDRRKTFDAGMNAHLAKPINERELLEALTSLIKE